jgi:hypothetical protein
MDGAATTFISLLNSTTSLAKVTAPLSWTYVDTAKAISRATLYDAGFR